MQSVVPCGKWTRRMACNILIFTTVNWTSTARHAAGFAQAGCMVGAVAPAGAPIGLSRYVSRRYRYRSLAPLRSLRKAILASRPDLIVSGDDRAVALLLRLYARQPKGSPVAALIARSLGEPEQYARVMSRQASLAAARQLGIRVPKTLPVASETELDAAIDTIGFPAVLKVDGSWGGEGVAVVKSKAEAEAAYRRFASGPSRLRCLARGLKRRDAHWLLSALSRKRQQITIQQFVEGQPAASGFAAWQGEVAGAVYYDVLKAEGAIGPPSVIRRVDCAQIAEATQLLARHFRLSGLHGLDFVRDSEGKVHLLEINPRATQGGTLRFGPGRDPAADLARRVAGEARSRPAIGNDMVVFFPGEWLRDRTDPIFRSAHHEAPWDDPAILKAALKDAGAPVEWAGQLGAPAEARPAPIGAPAMAGG